MRTASYASDLHVFKKEAEAATLLNACLGHNFSQALKKKHAAHMGWRFLETESQQSKERKVVFLWNILRDVAI